MRKLPSHIPPFSAEADQRMRFSRMSREERLEYVEPLLESENRVHERLCRGDWGEGFAFAMKELMERLPCSYMERTSEAYAGYFRLTNALARMGWPDEVLHDLLDIAIETETHDPPERIKPHWEEAGTIDTQADENDSMSAKCFKAVCRRGVFLALVPESHLTYEMCEEAVRADWRALQFVPQELRDEQIFQSARIAFWLEDKVIGRTIRREKKSMHDSIIRECRERGQPEKAFAILDRYGLIDLNGEFQCAARGPFDARALYFEQLPVGLQEKLFDEMKPFLGYSYAQEWRKKNGMAKTSLKGDGLALFRKIEAQVRMDGDGRSIGNESPAPSVCMELVKNYRDCLQYLPADRVDRKICMAAIERNPLALQFVRETLIDKPMALEAVRKNGMALQFVPEKLMDDEIEEAARAQNPDAGYFFRPKAESVKERKEREWQDQHDEWLEARERQREEWEAREAREREKWLEGQAMIAELEEEGNDEY